MVNQNKRMHFVIGTAVSLLCLYLIGRIIEPAEIWQILQQTHPRSLALAAIFIISYMGGRALRWQYLLGMQISYQDVFHAQNVGYLFTQILPFRIGDMMRAIMVGQRNDQISIPQGFSTMAIERILDMLLMVLLLPFALIRLESHPGWMLQAAWISGSLGTILLITLIILAHKRPFVHQIATQLLQKLPVDKAANWMTKVDAFLNGLTVFKSWRTGGTAVGLTLLVWIPIIWAYTAVLHAFDLPLSIYTAVYLMCAGAFSVAAPTSPGQIGVFHAGIIAAMTLIGTPAPIAAGFAIMYHAINFVIMILMGILSLLFVPWPWTMNTQNSRETKSLLAFIKSTQ